MDKKKNSIPLGIKFISILSFVLAFFYLAVTIVGFLWFRGMGRQQSLVTLLGIVLITLFLIIGVNLLRAQRWARVLALICAGLTFLGSLFWIFFSFYFFELISLLLAVYVIYLLIFDKSTAKFFK